MTSIGSVTSSYTPVVVPAATAPVQSPNPAAPDSAQQSASAVSAAPAVPTNANENAAATYTAVGDASASNIRGVNLNVSA
jgi:hypothetical protein